MIQVSNSNNQLVVTWATNLTDYYAFEDIKSVTPYTGGSTDYVIINFINENRNSSLRIPFTEISNQPGWTDVSVACADISTWMDTSIGGGLATEATLQNVETNTADIVSNTTGALRVPRMQRVTSSGNLSSLGIPIYSVSVANVGAANGTILGEIIKPGEIINFDASSISHYFNDFAYNATGTEFIIIYVI
jgi:hypothetical protein